MPLTKQYLRYVSGDCFGVICSRKTKALLFKRGGKENKSLLAVSPALENVIVWDVKTGEKVSVLSGANHEVTALCKTNITNTSVVGDDQLLAVGYDNGTISIWDLETCDCRVTFSGHKTAVTCLHFDSSNTRLVSGSNDTEIVVWDIIGENGLFRLKGHKGPITSCQFLANHNVLITCSKDTVTKLWDLDTKHCFETLVGHRSEVKGCVILKNETRLVTASSDRELRVYEISQPEVEEGSVDVLSSVSVKEGPVQCKLFGTIKKSPGKVLTIQADQHGRHFVVMSGDNTIEIYRIRTEDETEKILKKLTKKMKRKSLKQEQEGEELQAELEVTHEIYLYHTFSNKNRMKSCDIIYKTETNEILLLLTLHNNSLELHTISSADHTPSVSDSTSSLMYSISHPGHRSDIRTVCISGTGSLIASGSSDLVKIWKKGICLQTLPCGYAVCSCFIPGDRYLLVGTKSGQIFLFEISSGLLLDTFDAHTKAVWSVSVSPDRRGFVSGSADHDVKFWEFELASDEKNQERKRLTAVHIKTLKMSEDVLCVKYSPDQRLLAIALLDSTVKLFFVDTLKFYLSLYGHKLPVLTMDISSDSTLLVTGSADKNIKIWGLDFGDCHRSIFAHDDSIMAVQFVPKTHFIFSVSKDKTLKYWDGDKYQHIQTLKGHQGEIWCLFISNDGNTVVTGSHDMSLRIWECTQESLILSEEKENEREAEFEKVIIEGNDPVVPGERDDGEVGMAGKKTIETMQGAERIMEALEIYKEEIDKQIEHDEECLLLGKQIPLADPHPILKALGNISPKKYILSVVKKIKSSDLEKSLFVLPFSDAVELMKICDEWLQEEWEIELACRCLFFLLRLHHHQVTSSDILIHVVSSLQKHTMKSIDSVRDVIGFNLAGMRYLEQELKDHDVTVFKDLSVQVDAVRKRKRKKVL